MSIPPVNSNSNFSQQVIEDSKKREREEKISDVFESKVASAENPKAPKMVKATVENTSSVANLTPPAEIKSEFLEERELADGTILKIRSFKNKLPLGIRELTNGAILEGQFTPKGDLKSGKRTDRDGTIYQGAKFVNNKLEGTGIVTLPNGQQQVGVYKKGESVGSVW